MKKILVVMVACLVVVSAANAQSYLNWYTVNDPIGPDGSVLLNNAGDATLGALAQLILCYNLPSLPTTLSGNGLTGDNQLVDWTGCGFGGGDATFSGSYAMDTGVPPIATTNYVFVRVWDRPTSGSGNVPAAFDYGAGNVGAYYYDSDLSGTLVSSISAGGGFYNLVVPDIAQGSWTFLAVPEPGSMALGLIGLGVILIRRRLIRR